MRTKEIPTLADHLQTYLSNLEPERLKAAEGAAHEILGSIFRIEFGVGTLIQQAEKRAAEVPPSAGYPALKAQVLAQAKKFKAQRVLVEDSGAGTALIQELRGQVPGIIGVKPQGDKVSRMAVASAKFEAGQVFLPEQASWLPDFESELFAFPGGRHDDQCDSVSQALSGKNNSFISYLTGEEWNRMMLTISMSPRRRPTSV